ncbi:MAG TPA: hypothetical protein VF062_16850 [Candidatus Limnocylindrales bacterium]
MDNRLRLLLAVTLAGGILLAGCAKGGGPEETVTPIPSDSSLPAPSASPTPTSLPIPTSLPTAPSKSGGAGELVVTGVVEIVGVEGGCRALRTPGQTYEIQGGDPNVLKVGARVTVRGVIRDDLLTICQIGPVLQVISSRPA